MEKIDFEKILAELLTTGTKQNKNYIKSFLEQRGIEFKNNTFSLISNESMSIKPETTDTKVITGKYKPGMTVFNTIRSRAYIVKDVYFENRKKMLLLIDALNGEKNTTASTNPALRRWNISDAKIGDFICTEHFVFIFNGFRLDKDTLKWNVHYKCAAELHNHEDDDPFHIPAPQAHMGTKKDTDFRIATEQERLYLLEEIERHGYTWNHETIELEKHPYFKYNIGDWVVYRDNGELWKIENVVNHKYSMTMQDGTEKAFDCDFVNYCSDKWSIKNAQPGDVLYYTMPNGDEILAVFESFGSKFHKLSIAFCTTTDEITTNVLIDPELVIEPATDEQKQWLKDVITKTK